MSDSDELARCRECEDDVLRPELDADSANTENGGGVWDVGASDWWGRTEMTDEAMECGRRLSRGVKCEELGEPGPEFGGVM